MAGVNDLDRVFLCRADSGEAVEEVAMHSPARVVIEFSCHQSVMNADIVVEFHTLDFVPIMAANTAISSDGLGFCLGRHRVEFDFHDTTL